MVAPRISYVKFKREILCPATTQTTQVCIQDKNLRTEKNHRRPTTFWVDGALLTNFSHPPALLEASRRPASARQLGLDRDPGRASGNVTSQSSYASGITGRELNGATALWFLKAVSLDPVLATEHSLLCALLL